MSPSLAARPQALVAAASGGVLAVTAFVVTRYWQWMGLALLVIVLLLAAVVFYHLQHRRLLLQQRRLQMASDQVEGTIARQASQQVDDSVTGLRDEETQLADQFKSALASFRRRTGQSPFALPWYFVLGPDGAGGRQLISGSEFSWVVRDEANQPKGVHGVGGLRGLEGFLGKDAVFWAMAGDFHESTTPAQRGAWLELLGELKKAKPDRPVNGLIVTFPVDQLAEAGESVVDHLARGLRDRIQLVVDRLGVVFPVYVVFTAGDRISGFAETFAGLPSEKRREPWGVAFNWDPGRSGRQSAQACFDQGFGGLLQALLRRRAARLAELTDLDQRVRAFALPLQLQQLRSPMRRLIQVLFEPRASHDTPPFRGFYLTSAAPGADTIDQVFAGFAESMSVPLQEARPGPPMDVGPWFVGRLFTDVFLADRDLVTLSKRGEAQLRRRRQAVFAGFGAALLACGLLLSAGGVRNARLVDRVQRAAEEVRLSADAGFSARLVAIEQLRQRMAQLQATEPPESGGAGTPWWRWATGYRGSEVLDRARHYYAQTAADVFINPALRGISTSLETQVVQGGMPFGRLFHLYWAWRVLSRPEYLTSEDESVVAGEVRVALEMELSRLGVLGRAEAESLLHLQVREVCRSGSYLDDATLDSLQGRTATSIQERWDAEAVASLLDLIVREANPLVPALTLDSLVGDQGMIRAAPASRGVPGAYTRAGFARVRPGIRLLGSRQWLHDDLPRQAPDLQLQLQRRYAQDYVAQWASFITGLQVERLDPSQSSTRGLVARLVAPESPLFALLDSVARQTQLPSDGADGFGYVGMQFQPLVRFQGLVLHPAPARPSAGFGCVWPGSKKRDSGRPVPQFDSSRADVGDYLELLGELKKNAAAAYDRGVGDVYVDLDASAQRLQDYANALVAQNQTPAAGAIAHLLSLPACLVRDCGVAPPPAPGGGNAPPVVVRAAAGGGLPARVCSAWRLDLVPKFNRIRGLYPIDPRATASLTLEDFRRFFGPEGELMTFHRRHLESFVSEDGVARPEFVHLVPASLTTCLKRAAEVRRMLFSEPGAKMSFRLTVEADDLKDLPPALESVDLKMLGREFNYKFSAENESGVFEWPPRPEFQGADSAVIRARMKSGPSAVLRAPAGTWAVFRLLTSRSARPGTARVLIPSGGGGSFSMIYRVAVLNESRSTFAPVLSEFRLPADLGPAR